MRKRNDIVGHLTRGQLLDAARKGSAVFTEHLKVCKECAKAVDLLTRYPVSGCLQLPDPPSGWVSKAIEIPRARSMSASLRQLVGALVFDSWLAPAVAEVRGVGSHGNRRLKFEAEDIALDMRAEDHGANWSFVAHVSGPAVGESVIRCDGREMNPDAHGLFQWESPRPPKKLSVQTPLVTMEISSIRWKKPSKK
jgi:hypothetical protein